MGHRPTTERELAALIGGAAAAGDKLELRGGGSKVPIGAADRAAAIVDLRGFTGVVDYDPAELVLTARAGTPLAEIEALVAGERQMLAFEPFDHGPLFGGASGAATIGGIAAAGIAGSRRPFAGGARDHLLGFRAVSGRGEAFVGGAKVVKNVTGYDLPKVMAGSWGRLAALTEVSFKVLPAPRETATWGVSGLDPAHAYAAMAAAQGSQADPSGVAYLPGWENGASLTAFRLQGIAPSIVARATTLRHALAAFGAVAPIERDPWGQLRTLAPLADAATLWRVSLPPRAFPLFVARFPETTWLADWGGGLVWLGGGDAAAVRAAAVAAGGHAMLMRGSGTPTFHHQPPALAALEARVRRAFDPAGIFETGRFDAH